MNKLTEKVTMERNVPDRIADLVYFYKYIMKHTNDEVILSDDELVTLAHAFWDMQHGDD